MHLAVLIVHSTCIVASGRQIIFDNEVLVNNVQVYMLCVQVLCPVMNGVISKILLW